MKLFAMALSLTTLSLTASLASAESFKLDLEKSQLTWKGSKVTGDSHNGTLKLKSGSIEVVKGQVTGGKFEIDMNSLNNVDLAGSPEYKAKLEGHLKSPDFFDVANNPVSVFEIEKVTPVKGDEYTIAGKLTVRGKTNPISFPAKIKIAKGSASADGALSFDRTQYNVVYNSKTLMGKIKELTADKIIKDEVEIGLSLQAKK